MPTEDDNNPAARRITMRRARGTSFGQGTSTRTESFRGNEPLDAEDDEIDVQIDPQQMRDRIIDTARRRPPPQLRGPAPPVAPQDIPSPGGQGGTPDPRARLHEVAQAGSASYSKEYRLTLLHRLLIRRVPLDQIAAQLGVSISTVQKDRVELKERLRGIARELNINEIVGGQSEKYDELAGMALRIASNEQTPTAMRLASMRTALAAEADRTRFLNTAGVFDVLRYRKAEDGSDVSDVQRLMDNTARMFERLLEQDVTQAPRNPIRRTRRPARPAGFSKMTMDDSDASNSSDENVEL